MFGLQKTNFITLENIAVRNSGVIDNQPMLE
jgi:hypothetical protein